MYYDINMPEIDEDFFECRNVAGERLKFMIDSSREKSAIPMSVLHWLKPEFSWPSFDDLTFGYKNAVFSVLIMYCRNTEDGLLHFWLPLGRDQRLLEAAKKYNLIPCVFPIYPDTKQPLGKGWNLGAFPNICEGVYPLKAGTDELVEMSEWELKNRAVELVKQNLRKKGLKIKNYCDIDDVNPQIWFTDEDGSPAWVSVGISRYQKPAVFDPTIIQNQLKNFHGYFATVTFCGETVDSPIYRPKGPRFSFNGIEMVYGIKDD